jgi:hypothetical protein
MTLRHIVEWRYGSDILNNVSCQLYAPTASPPRGIELPFSMNSEVGAQSRSRNYEEYKRNPLPGLEPLSYSPQPSRYTECANSTHYGPQLIMDHVYNFN